MPKQEILEKLRFDMEVQNRTKEWEVNIFWLYIHDPGFQEIIARL